MKAFAVASVLLLKACRLDSRDPRSEEILEMNEVAEELLQGVPPDSACRHCFGRRRRSMRKRSPPRRKLQVRTHTSPG